MMCRVTTRADYSKWHRKFVWFPTLVSDEAGQMWWVWLQTVERKWTSGRDGWWDYRLYEKPFAGDL